MISLLISWLLIIFACPGALAEASAPREPSQSDATLPTSVREDVTVAEGGAAINSAARVTENKSFGGVPVLISRPRLVSLKTRLVVLFHGFGPPQTPQVLAGVLRLEKMDAILAFVNLPLVAGRMPAGGIDELRRVQEKDFVNGFFFRSISSAAEELPRVVNELNATYHLEANQEIGLFGFSAGGAAALLALLESDLPITAAVIVNAPMSVEQNVENWENLFKKHFEWDSTSREAASRYDLVLQADKIAERKILPALLLIQGDADEQFGIEATRRAYEALKRRYIARGEVDRIQFEVIHGLAHNFGPAPNALGSVRTSIGQEIEQKTENWFELFLRHAR